jgi:Bacterial PH domain
MNIMSKFAHFMMNNSYEVDAKAQEDKLRVTEPLLLHPHEHIELALKEGRDGRDKSYFTTHRILMKDGMGVSKKRKNFESMPYSSIQGFSVTTAGAFDDDTELEVWGSAGRIVLHLAKGQVNLFGIQQFLSLAVIKYHMPEGTPDPVPVQQVGMVNAFTSWITGDAANADLHKVEARFKTETPVLLQNETVRLAFHTGRDYLVMTDLRILKIDVQGMLGKKVEFETILWSSIAASTIATSSGIFDRDMEMVLHTTIEPQDKKDRSKIELDFRRGKVDIYAVQTMIANHILGKDESPLEDVDVGKSGWSWANWFDREASRPMDPKAMERNLRSNPPILQGREHVEIAFKGIRDMIVFTTKRLIIVDPRGVTGKKVEYTSIPYKSMLAFAIETAGAVADMDTEIMIWTNMNAIPENDKADPPEPAQPGYSFVELEFNKKLVNIVALKLFLSQRILKASGTNTYESSAPVPCLEPNNSVIANFFSYFTGNQRAIDPKVMDEKLHKETPVLLDDERVIMAFQAGRDLTLFTNLRVMVMDIQGMIGKRVSYRSIPFTSVRAFSVESSGSWDRDAELDLYTGNFWNMGKIEMDFRKGQVDILSIHRFLSAMILGDAEEQASYLDSQGAALHVHSKGGLGAFINWLGNNSAEEDASELDSQLHSEAPILMAKEKVERVYKSGRDMFIYTSHRVILMNTQGLIGKKVEYLVSQSHRAFRRFRTAFR